VTFFRFARNAARPSKFGVKRPWRRRRPPAQAEAVSHPARRTGPLTQGHLRAHRTGSSPVVATCFRLSRPAALHLQTIGTTHDDADDDRKRHDHQRYIRRVQRDGADQVRNNENFQTEQQTNAELKPLLRCLNSRPNRQPATKQSWPFFIFLRLRINQ
jgi:hypothetical protein